MNTTNKELKNPFKVGDTVIYHSELCDKSFYSEAKEYCEHDYDKLIDGNEYKVLSLCSNGSGINNYIKVSKKEWCLPCDVFTLKEEEFVLPEKWCIDQWLDVELIGNWFYQNNDTGHNNLYKPKWIGSSHYFHHPRISKGSLAHDVPYDGYTELTLEQFKKYILKETIKEDKTMKKQEFSIESSVGLKRAFIEESGFEYWNKDGVEYGLNKFKSLSPASGHKNKFGATGNISSKHFILPQQWSEAMAYVKEYFKDEEIINLNYGDYLFITNKIESNSCVNDVVKVTRLEKESEYNGYWVSYQNIVTQKNGGFRQSAYTNNFRIATSKEVKDKTPTSEMFKLGAYQAEVKQEGTIIAGRGGVTNMDIMDFYSAYTKGRLSFNLTGFSMKPQTFNIGCVENVPIKDILAICEYIEKNELG